MQDFLERFGQQHDDGTYYFSNVRSGLIVAMVKHTDAQDRPPLSIC